MEAAEEAVVWATSAHCAHATHAVIRQPREKRTERIAVVVITSIHVVVLFLIRILIIVFFESRKEREDGQRELRVLRGQQRGKSAMERGEMEASQGEGREKCQVTLAGSAKMGE